MPHPEPSPHSPEQELRISFCFQTLIQHILNALGMLTNTMAEQCWGELAAITAERITYTRQFWDVMASAYSGHVVVFAHPNTLRALEATASLEPDMRPGWVQAWISAPANGQLFVMRCHCTCHQPSIRLPLALGDKECCQCSAKRG